MKIYLKERIKEKGYTMKDISKILNIQYDTLSTWSRGVHEPDYKSLFDISRFLNIPVDYFFVEKIENSEKHISQEDFKKILDLQNQINEIYAKYR